MGRGSPDGGGRIQDLGDRPPGSGELEKVMVTQRPIRWSAASGQGLGQRLTVSLLDIGHSLAGASEQTKNESWRNSRGLLRHHVLSKGRKLLAEVELKPTCSTNTSCSLIRPRAE